MTNKSKLKCRYCNSDDLYLQQCIITRTDISEDDGYNVFYEESSHIPLLIRFPNEIKKKTVVEGYVSNVDLFATILDYLEIEGNYPTDGSSLRDLIERIWRVYRSIDPPKPAIISTLNGQRPECFALQQQSG